MTVVPILLRFVRQRAAWMTDSTGDATLTIALAGEPVPTAVLATARDAPVPEETSIVEAFNDGKCVWYPVVLVVVIKS